MTGIILLILSVVLPGNFVMKVHHTLNLPRLHVRLR